MAAQKQSLPSFASILSVFSIVFYSAGFLRVELELNEQKKRINTLQSVAAETKPSSHVRDLLKLTKNARELESVELLRNRHQADSVKNTTEAKSTPDTIAILKINKLLSELKPHLCHAKGDTCPPGPPGPPGTRGEKGSRGRRGQKGRTGNKGDRGIMGSPGESGKQGIMGPVGLKGEAGIKGQKGDLGPAGMPGHRGIRGEKGSRGRRGQKGRTGNKGDRGIMGSPGKSSKQNIMGPAGMKAEAGIRGQKRNLGPAGMPGDRGIMGLPGKKGKQGIMGPVCLKGEAGINGQKGNLGPTGMPGDKGEPCLHGLTASNIFGSLNSKYLDKLNSYLRPVLQSKSRSRFVRRWHAKTDGWAASTFHSNCDGKGPTVTIVQVGSYIFGGYTDKSWSSPNNLALNQPASQVSTVHGGVASRAVDGDTSTGYGDNSCTHTNFANDAWWRVDLGSPFPVAEVVIVNRQCTGACANVLKAFEIRIGNSTLSADSSNQICGSSLQVAAGRKKSFRCVSAIRGRYVFIIIPGNNKILTICEVEVYSTISHNLALNQPASQVSTVHGGNASRAVDGDTSTAYRDNSCTHTKFSNDAWWRVDLGSPFPVAEVVIVNRQCTGACTDYMKSFEIRIGNSTTGADSSNQICGSSLQVATGQRKSFRCVSTIRGRYVYIIIPGNNKILTICEVEVYPTISSSCLYVSSNKSFLFSLYNINGYAPVKLKIKSSGYRKALYTCYTGPTFGGGADLYISNNAASNRRSYTSCGYSYPLPPGYSASRSSCRFYAGGQSYKFTPSDIEVFYETTT